MVTLRPQLKQSQVNIEMDVEQGLMVKSYPGAYYHIISNMFVNSLRHAFPDKRGNIRIYIHKEGDSLHLHYQDDGVGMDDPTRSKIFDPFFTTKRGQGGTGLGLYMTYNIVTQRLGGSITVCSEPGKGTQFDIEVPFDLPDTDQNASHFSRV
jgi:signal transduction histidine kinase